MAKQGFVDSARRWEPFLSWEPKSGCVSHIPAFLAWFPSSSMETDLTECLELDGEVIVILDPQLSQSDTTLHLPHIAIVRSFYILEFILLKILCLYNVFWLYPFPTPSTLPRLP